MFDSIFLDDFVLVLNDNNPNTLFYWDGFIYDKKILEEIREESCYAEFLTGFEQTLDQFHNGEYKAAGLDLKQISSERFYTMKVNRADRLLFVTISIDKQDFALLLEIRLHHNYRDSALMNGNIQHFTKLMNAASELKYHPNFPKITSEIAQPSLDLPVDIPPQDEYRRIKRHREQYICLNSTQYDASLWSDKPCILDGPAGVGKTLIELIRMDRLLHELAEESPCEFFYISPTVRLANEAQRMFEELSDLKETPHTIHFFSYPEYIHHIYPASKQLLARDDDLDIFIQFYQRRQRTKTFSPLTKAQLANYKNAFALLAGREVSNISERDRAILGNADDFLAYTQAFDDYMRDMAKRKKLHILYSVLPAEIYQNPTQRRILFADEAQYFNYAQIQNITRLTSECCISLDNQQITNSDFSIKSLVKQALGPEHRHFILQNNYRCPTDVISVCDRLSNAKYQVTQCVADPYESTYITAPEFIKPGAIHWVNPDNFSQYLATIDFSSGENVVVTYDAYKEEAHTLFNTEYVFNFEEISGFTFKKVWCHRIFETADFAKINKLLSEYDPEKERKQSRMKLSDAHLQKYKKAFHRVYVAWTRAEVELLVHYSSSTEISNIISFIDGEEFRKNTDIQPIVITPPNPGKVMLIIERMILAGNIRQAIWLFSKNNFSNFESFKTEVLSRQATLESQKIAPLKIATGVIPSTQAGYRDSKETKVSFDIYALANLCRKESLRDFLRSPNALEKLCELPVHKKRSPWEIILSDEKKRNILTQALFEINDTEQLKFALTLAIRAEKVPFITELLSRKVIPDESHVLLALDNEALLGLAIPLIQTTDPSASLPNALYKAVKQGKFLEAITIMNGRPQTCNINHKIIYYALYNGATYDFIFKLIFLISKVDRINFDTVYQRRTNQKSGTLLLHCISLKQFTTATLLIGLGARVDLDLLILQECMTNQASDEFIIALLDRGLSSEQINFTDITGECALKVAADTDRQDLVIELLQHGADKSVYLSPKKKVSILIYAITISNQPLAGKIIDLYPELVTSSDVGCVAEALVSGFDDAFIIRLLRLGADVNAVGLQNITPLTLLTQPAFRNDLLILLITSYPCELDKKSGYVGMQCISALTNSILVNNIEAARCLLSSGASAEDPPELLSVAINYNMPGDIIISLINNGAKKHIHYTDSSDWSGMSAYDLALLANSPPYDKTVFDALRKAAQEVSVPIQYRDPTTDNSDGVINQSNRTNTSLYPRNFLKTLNQSTIRKGNDRQADNHSEELTNKRFS